MFDQKRANFFHLHRLDSEHFWCKWHQTN